MWKKGLALTCIRANFLLTVLKVAKIQTSYKLHSANANCVERAGPQALQKEQQIVAARPPPPVMATGRHMQSYCNAQSRCQLDSLPFMHCSSPYTNQIAIWKLFVNHCWCLCHFETACQGACYTAFQSGVDEKSCCGRKRLWLKKQPEKVWTGFQPPVLCRPPLHTSHAHVSFQWQKIISSKGSHLLQSFSCWVN